jgi:hypothetical protein
MVDIRPLSQNSVEQITIDVKIKASQGKRSYTDEEARIVLKATLAEVDPMRRWVLWLCAYSSARLSENCQVHQEDVISVEGIACIMKLDPKANSLQAFTSNCYDISEALAGFGQLDLAENHTAARLFWDP